MSFPSLRVPKRTDLHSRVRTPPSSSGAILFRATEKLKRVPVRPSSAAAPKPRNSALSMYTRPVTSQLRVSTPTSPISSPRQLLTFDRERLCEELIEVKIGNNALRTENVRLRTQVAVMEKEQSKKGGEESSSLVTTLKQSLKDAKELVRIKDEELSLLRKELKSTKLAEMDVELRLYQEECRRLAEVLKTSSAESDLQGRETASEDLRQENTALREDIARLSKRLKEAQDLANVRKAKSREVVNENEELRNAVEALRKEAAALREKHSAETQSIVRDWEAKTTALLSERDRLREEVSAVQTELQLLRSTLENRDTVEDSEAEGLRSDLAAVKSNGLKLKLENIELSDKLKKLVQDFDSVQAEHKSAMRELSRAHRSDIDTIKADYDREISRYRDRLEGEAAANRSLLATAAELEKANLHLQEQLGKCQSRDQQLRDRLESAGKEAEVAGSESMRLSLDLDAQVLKTARMRQALSVVLDNAFARIAAAASTSEPAKKEIERLLETGDGGFESAELRSVVDALGLGIDPEQVAGIAVLLDNGSGLISAESFRKHLTHRKSLQAEDGVPASTEGTHRQKGSNNPFTVEPDLRRASISSSSSAEDHTNVHSSAGGKSDLREELTAVLRHISLRLQIHRVAKDDMQQLLFPDYSEPKLITIQEYKSQLAVDPLSITDPNSQQLLAILALGLPARKEELSRDLEGERVDCVTAVQRLLGALDHWDIFTQEREEEFDALIQQEIGANLVPLRTFCIASDPSRSGFLPISAFQSHLDSLHIDFPPEVRHYLELLFYSHNQSLDSVPYLAFFSAYVDTPPAEEPLLAQVAKALAAKSGSHGACAVFAVRDGA